MEYAGASRTVNYVSAHDNETLFGGITLRSASHVLFRAMPSRRVAVAVMALSRGCLFSRRRRDSSQQEPGPRQLQQR